MPIFSNVCLELNIATIQLRETNNMNSWCPTAVLYEHGYQNEALYIGCYIFILTLHSWTIREILLLFDIRILEVFPYPRENINSNPYIRHTDEKSWLTHLFMFLLKADKRNITNIKHLKYLKMGIRKFQIFEFLKWLNNHTTLKSRLKHTEKGNV